MQSPLIQPKNPERQDKGSAMTVLQIELDDPTEEGWALHVTFRGQRRTSLLYQQTGLPYRLPDGTVLVPTPSWWLRIRQPASDEWLGDVGDHFMNSLATAVRRIWGSEIDGWCPEMQRKSAAGPQARAEPTSDVPIPSTSRQSTPRLLPKMPPPEHTRRKR
jgi:hypothetical protein